VWIPPHHQHELLAHGPFRGWSVYIVEEACARLSDRPRVIRRSGFDMPAEIAKLAERIIEPVAVKLTTQERKHVVGQIRSAFAQFNVKRTADTNLENIAVHILEPVQPRLTEAECTRMLDRLRGAMAAFCQVDLGQGAA
jgi:hypothetical protein